MGDAFIPHFAGWMRHLSEKLGLRTLKYFFRSDENFEKPRGESENRGNRMATRLEEGSRIGIAYGMRRRNGKAPDWIGIASS